MQTAWVDISIPFRVRVWDHDMIMITNDQNKRGSDKHQLVLVGQQVVEAHAAVDGCSDHGSKEIIKSY